MIASSASRSAVTDTGPGLSADSVAHLFERYWRGAESTYKGTGLGLSIAHGIIAAHGGRIWAESELGVGTTLSFTIPMADQTLLFVPPEPEAATR